jgi:ligand-binding sensor domain-containing protein
VDNVRIGAVNRLLRNEQAVWAATSSGLWVFNIPDLKARRFNKVASGIISDNVLCLALKDGEIWCGTEAGLCVYNLKNDDWTTIPTELKDQSGSSVGFEKINVIGFVGKWVFLGGERGGIMYFDRHNRQNNPRMQYVFDAPPFLGFPVSALAERKGNLWVGTTAGIFRVELASPDAEEIKLVFQAVSLPEKTSEKQLGAVRGLCLKNGVDGMICGSDRGLYLFGDDGAARVSVSPLDYYNFGSITDFDSGEEGLWCVIGSRLGVVEKVGTNAPAATIFKIVKN